MKRLGGSSGLSNNCASYKECMYNISMWKFVGQYVYNISLVGQYVHQYVEIHLCRSESSAGIHPILPE